MYKPQYTRTAMALHWLIAFLLAGQFIFGWLLDGIARNTPARGFYINLHKSTGIVIGLLIVVRIVWRLTHRAPPLPPALAQWQQRVARISHLAMYLCMLLIPLSGYLAANFSKHGIKFFNTFKWAPWAGDDQLLYMFFKQTHQVTTVLLAALIAVHLLAVAKHALLDRSPIFARMWPWAAAHN